MIGIQGRASIAEGNGPSRKRIAYVVSHPIQYQAPLLRRISADDDLDIHVLFLTDFSVRTYQDKGFGQTVSWDVPLLDGYSSELLPGWGNHENYHPPFRPFNFGLRRRLRQGDFDAVWIHGYAHASSLLAAFAAKSLGLPVLMRAESQKGSAAGTGSLRKFKELVIGKLFRLFDAFLAIGTLNSRYYEEYGVEKEKIFLVPYAVDNEFFQRRVAEVSAFREELRASLGLDPNRPVILFASKLIARKRAVDLIQAYRLLAGEDGSEPHPYLLIIGDGDQRASLEAEVSAWGWESIRFLGFKNQRELPAYYDLCDVFVLASEREPWGLVVNEVMNAAKPIVVSDGVGSATDLVRNGENGYVVPVGDVKALAHGLRDVLEDEKKAKAMGERSLNIIRQWGFEEDVQGLKAAVNYVQREVAKVRRSS